MCGMLHCQHQQERLELGLQNIAMVSRSFLSHEEDIITCKNALVDLGLDISDPGLAPPGSKCGPDHMCHNLKCVPLDELIVRCPNDCNGHGVCDNYGQCHCQQPWSGVDCGVKDNLITMLVASIMCLLSIVLVVFLILRLWNLICGYRADKEEFSVLIEKVDNNHWQTISTNQIPIPRAFQL